VQAGDELERAESTACPSSRAPCPRWACTRARPRRHCGCAGLPPPTTGLLADTRESAIAEYLDGWKRRIERVGTVNFPDAARRSALSGNPVLECRSAPTATSSRWWYGARAAHPELDAAALRIVRLASPFDRSRPPWRDSYPRLRFAYEWQFLKGHLGEGTAWAPEP